ncbi:MAG: GyrI-like domain-containing protein [Actinomycetota bacterium]|nr:GyrI-like domain-containing protein [Actinomycetota bacterium]MDZ4179687.1 GyrI-like domain-containing protein [Coriobacteriia bacterium]
MDKLDLKKELKHLYLPSAKQIVAVDVPPMSFLMLDGEGDPNTSPAYGDAVEALFGLSYAIKFAVKKGPLAIDYGVMPLEGLWWADDMSDFVTGDRTRWKWTMMIMQPQFVTRELVEETREAVLKKKNPVALPAVRFETFTEGAAAQTMHVGPFTEEGPVIERVHDFIEQAGHERAGKHHEIYLTDIRKADPAKWKTVIRQPMK